MDHRDVYEWSALHHACLHGHLDVVKVLVEYGHPEININSVNSSNNTPLHIAAKNGHKNICEYLVEFAKPIRADVLLKGLDNDTPN